MDVNRNNQETEGPKDVVKKENNPLDLSLTKKEQEHNVEEEDEDDSIEVNDDEVKNEVKNEVSLAQSPIFSYHSHFSYSLILIQATQTSHWLIFCQPVLLRLLSYENENDNGDDKHLRSRTELS